MRSYSMNSPLKFSTHHFVLLQQLLVLHADLLVQAGDRLLQLCHGDHVVGTVWIQNAARVPAHATHLLGRQVRQGILAQQLISVAPCRRQPIAAVLLDLMWLIAAVVSPLARSSVRLYLTGLGVGPLLGERAEPAQELAVNLRRRGNESVQRRD